MAEFKVREILEATSGRLIQGDNKVIFKGISTDTRTLKEGDIFIALKGRNFDGHNFIKEALEKKALGAIVEREIVLKDKPNFCIFLVEDTLSSLRKIAIYHSQRFNIPIIAITGSNGKTTVKEMIYHLLSPYFPILKTPYNYNNQIGLALTILEMNKNHRAAVFELGINHKGEMEILRDLVKPKIAVFTNIGKSHLEFLDSPFGVLKEKVSLIANFKETNTVVFNADDLLLKEWFFIHKEGFSSLSFGIENEADFKADNLSCSEKGISFRIKNIQFFLPLLGRHNIYNALSSIAVGSLFNISLREMSLSLKDFRPPMMRMNVLRIKKDNREFIIIDDTYNANPNSVISAIDSLLLFNTLGRRFLVLGDMLELGEQSLSCHREIGLYLSDKKGLDFLLTLGKYSLEINKVVKSSGNVKEIKHFNSPLEIIEFLKENVNSHDILLVKGSRSMHMEEIVKGLLEEIKVAIS